MIQTHKPVTLHELPINESTIHTIFKNAAPMVLWVTSNPSVAHLIKQIKPAYQVRCITGANNNEFDDILNAIENQKVDVIVLGIEQLLNQPKLERILKLITSISHVVVDHIHHLSPISFDYRPEYEHLSILFNALTQAHWSFISNSLSESDFKAITFKVNIHHIKNSNQLNRSISNHQVNDISQLIQLLSETIMESRTLIVTHDYFEAEIVAFLLNQLMPCGVVHRKVEESKKVQTLNEWQSGIISCLVITSDTILPYPYPFVDQVIWLDYPLNWYQVAFYKELYAAKKHAIMTYHDPSYLQISMHQFPFDHRLEEIMITLENNHHGLTMREIERFINIDSYVCEKAMKGLRVFGQVDKRSMHYFPIEGTTFSKDELEGIHSKKLAYFKDFLADIVKTEPFQLQVDDNIRHVVTHSAMPIRPKVLFPITFYPKSLILKNHQTEYGYLFISFPYNPYTRAHDIDSIMTSNLKDNETQSIVPLYHHETDMSELIKHLSQLNQSPIHHIFDKFDASLLHTMKNPFHKMTMIINQLTLLKTSYLSDSVFVVANHGDHFWQMGVVGYELLSRNMCKKVIVIFNQP